MRHTLPVSCSLNYERCHFGKLNFFNQIAFKTSEVHKMKRGEDDLWHALLTDSFKVVLWYYSIILH